MKRSPAPKPQRVRRTGISISIEESLAARLRQMASIESRLLSAVITRLLRKGLAYESVFGQLPAHSGIESETEVISELNSLAAQRR